MARTSPARLEILQTLEVANKPLSPLELAHALNRTKGSTRELLAQMSKAGVIVTTGRGLYALPEPSAGGQPDFGPDEPDVLPDEPDDAADEPGDSHQPLIDKPDNPTGIWVFQVDGEAIPLSLHRKRKGYS